MPISKQMGNFASAMSKESTYSTSSFFEPVAGEAGAQFTDFSTEPCPCAGFVLHRAKRFGQWWLLKSVDPNAPEQERLREQLEQEYRVGQRLRHPGLTRLIALQPVQELEAECLISEWVDGYTWSEFIASRPNRGTAQKVARELLDAMQYYLGKGVTHGCLDDRHVLVTRNGLNVKIIHFDTAASRPAVADLQAAGLLLQELPLPGRQHRVACHCAQGKFTQIGQLIHDFDRAGSHRTGQVMGLVALVLAATIALVAGYRQRVHREGLVSDPEATVINGSSNASTYVNANQALVSFLPWSTDSINPATPGPVPESKAVDLGLSVKWAPMNVGTKEGVANHVGGYYGWGDTTDFVIQSLDSYWPASKPIAPIAGTRIDVARLRWGGRWRMPTRDEVQELIDRCQWQLVNEKHHVAGYRVTGPNGNSIFLPFGGDQDVFNYENIGELGFYWTATPQWGNTRNAHYLRLSNNAVSVNDVKPFSLSMSIRPVL